MDELADKLSELLGNEDSLNMIKNIASGLLSGNEEADSPSTSSPLLSMLGAGNGSLLGGLDSKTIGKITHAIGNSSIKDENLNLLMALKPHLSKKRSEKMDSAINMLKLSKMAMAFFEK